MKTAASISLLLSLALISALIYVWKNPGRTETDSVAPASPTIGTQVQAVVPKAPPVMVRQVVETRPFRWSQLLSTNGDYRIFVANLRAAGCPEGVVEDIVRGDAQRAFYARRVELGVDGTAPGPWSVQSQLETVAYVLGQTMTDNARTVATGRDPQPARVATLAAFLQKAELTREGASDEEKRQAACLRQNLLTQMSVAAQAQDLPLHPVQQVNQNRGTQYAQSAAQNTQPTASGTGGVPRPWPPRPNPMLLQAAEARSVLGGLFGMGAVMQYEQYAIMQSAQPQPQN
ncbi:MAG TPA: hypothetical protein VFY06_06920 [Verrucomicrobiae bacterium]|nr:hypothetical protein [Verrucomicrobiae bacterium]